MVGAPVYKCVVTGNCYIICCLSGKFKRYQDCIIAKIRVLSMIVHVCGKFGRNDKCSVFKRLLGCVQ